MQLCRRAPRRRVAAQLRQEVAVRPVSPIIGSLFRQAQQLHIFGVEVPQERRVVHPSVARDGLGVAAKLFVAQAVVVLLKAKRPPSLRKDDAI